MTHRRAHVIIPCHAATAGCASYGAGHNTHTVQATLAGRFPRGWRRAVVEEVNGLLLTLSYPDSSEGIVVWHHLPLDVVVGPGTEVRVHERHALMEVDTHWISVAVSDPVVHDTGADARRVSTCTES